MIGASTILTEVVDINRFRTYEKFHSFIGLVPSTNSSDVVEKIRGITHRSNRRLRNVLIEVSWIAIRYNTEQYYKNRLLPGDCYGFSNQFGTDYSYST